MSREVADQTFGKLKPELLICQGMWQDLALKLPGIDHHNIEEEIEDVLAPLDMPSRGHGVVGPMLIAQIHTTHETAVKSTAWRPVDLYIDKISVHFPPQVNQLIASCLTHGRQYFHGLVLCLVAPP